MHWYQNKPAAMTNSIRKTKTVFVSEPLNH